MKKLFIAIFLMPFFGFSLENKTLDSLQVELRNSISKKDETKIYDISEILLVEYIEFYSSEIQSHSSLIDQYLENNYSVKIDANNNLIKGLITCYQGGLEEGIVYCNKSYVLFDKAKMKIKASEALFTIANIYLVLAEDSLAENYADKVIVTKSGGYNKYKTSAITLKGMIHKNRRRYDNASYYLINALKLAEMNNDHQSMDEIYLELSDLNLQLGKLAQAEKYALEHIQLGNKYQDQNYIAKGHSSLGRVFDRSTDPVVRKKAAKHYLFAKEIFKKINDESRVNELNLFLAQFYFKNEEYDKSILFVDTSQIYFKKINDIHGLINCYNIRGRNYLFLKKYNQSEKNYSNAINLSTSYNITQYNRSLYSDIATLYEEKGDNENALKFYRKYVSIEEALFDEEKHKQIAELETKYETEKKDREIEILASKNAINQLEIKQKNTYLYGAVGLFVLFGLVGFLLFRQSKIKQEQKTSLLEQKLLRTQMNPHFMSNALASIQMYMYKNDPKEAARYLGKYGKLTRQILEASRKSYIPLEDELNMLENYLTIQQLIAPKSFDFKVNVDEEIEIQEVLIPPMIAQPFIENAIKHGLEQKKEDDRTLLVAFECQGNELLLSIVDNGIGRNMVRESRGERHHFSYATTITNERIAFLKKKHKGKISFNIIDLVDSSIVKGTKVVFRMPLIYNV